MDIIKQIIDLIMGLLGQGGDDAKQLPKEAAKPEKATTKNAVKGLEDVEGAENIKVASGEVKEQRDGGALIEDEDDGELLWISQVDDEVARDAYEDCWGPLDGPDDDSLARFMMHETVFNMAMQADAHEAEEKLQEFGYADAGEFFKARMTIIKHFGTPSGPNVGDAVLDSQRVMSASMKGAALRLEAERESSVAADPELVAPIHGVTIESYAQMSTQAAGKSPEEWAEMLGQNGLDQAKWEEIASGWMERMQNDTTHTLTQLYGAAFQGAGAGQFGAQAAAHAATGYDGTAAAGEAPMEFERCCEIQGATGAWSDTGQDVNAMLEKTFGMNAMDWAAANSWWMSQMMADVSMFDKYNTLVEEYQKKYSANAPDAPDDDLEF